MAIGLQTLNGNCFFLAFAEGQERARHCPFHTNYHPLTLPHLHPHLLEYSREPAHTRVAHQRCFPASSCLTSGVPVIPSPRTPTLPMNARIHICAQKLSSTGKAQEARLWRRLFCFLVLFMPGLLGFCRAAEVKGDIVSLFSPGLQYVPRVWLRPLDSLHDKALFPRLSPLPYCCLPRAMSQV